MVRSHRYGIDAFHQFAKPAADAIALGRGAVLLGDGEADADRAIIVAAVSLQHKSCGVRPRAIATARKSARCLSRSIKNLRRGDVRAQALRRLRPRARRAARTLRPPTVARRARKP